MEDVVERPRGLRPAQKSANSCDILRTHGRCKFGDECYYAHSQEESELFREWFKAVKRQQAKESGGINPERYFRTQICARWREGRCMNGAACTFAHGEENLRAPPRALLPPTREGSARWEEGPGMSSPPRPRGPPPCRYWHDYGNCRHGDQCQFAHGENMEHSSSGRQQPPPGLATPQKERERDVAEAEGPQGPPPCHPDKYKSQLCTYFMDQGYCRHGAACTFAHGMHELRQLHRHSSYSRHSLAEGEGEFYDDWEKPRRPAPPGFGPSLRGPPPPPPAHSAGASASLDPTPAEVYGQQGAPAPTMRHVPSSIGPLPSLASSDGGVALSDDDFPPLASGAAPRRSPNSAKASEGGIRVRTGVAGSVQGSDGPCTPSRDAGMGPASAGIGSPSMASDQGASRPLSAASTELPLVPAPQPAEGQAAAAAEAAGGVAGAAEGPIAESPAETAAEGAGYASSSAGGSSLDGYGAGPSATGGSDYETAEEEDAGLARSEGQEAEAAHAGKAAGAAAAVEGEGEREGSVSFLAPAATQAPSAQQPPVAVTFSPAGPLSTRSSASDLDHALSAALSGEQQQASPAAAADPAPVSAAPPLPPLDVAAIHSFRCPLAKCLLTDPVVAADGFTYERAAIHDWLYRRNQDVSPVTGQPLVHKMLSPNHSVRGMVAEVAHLLRCVAGGMPLPQPPPSVVAAAWPYPPPAMPPHLPTDC